MTTIQSRLSEKAFVQRKLNHLQRYMDVFRGMGAEVRYKFRVSPYAQISLQWNEGTTLQLMTIILIRELPALVRGVLNASPLRDGPHLTTSARTSEFSQVVIVESFTVSIFIPPFST